MKIFTVLGKEKKNKLSPVYVMTYISGERVLINTKVEISKDQFDEKRGQIRGKSDTVNDNNLMVEQVRSRVNQILIKYRLQGKTITPRMLKNEFNHPSLDIDFLAWMENEMKVKKSEVGIRRMIKYKTILNKLREFRKNIYFSEIDHFFIEEFRGWCKETKKNDVNTIAATLAVVKVFCRRAVKKGLLREDPFLDIKIKHGAVDRVFCTEEELTTLWDIYQHKELKPHLHSVLRHFLFMCFTGLRISDLKTLQFDNILNDKIHFYPVKTRQQKKQLVKIPLISNAKQLIEDEGNESGLIFTTITEQKMNDNIKDIAKAAKINKPLTNHSGRHTFATIFIQKTSDVATLQRLLGHSRITETLVYVHITEKNLEKQISTFEKDLTINKKPGL